VFEADSHAVEVAGLSRTTHTAEIIRPSTAASQPARASRALATCRRRTTNSPNAFIRLQRTRRNRQIPIGPKTAIFIPRVRSLKASDAGPGASGCPYDGRHPKPLTEAAIPVTAVEQHLSTRCRPAVGQPLAASPAICPKLAFGPYDPACVKTRTRQLSTNYLYNINPVHREISSIGTPARHKISPTSDTSAFLHSQDPIRS
jgi:hypothetical protein